MDGDTILNPPQAQQPHFYVNSKGQLELRYEPPSSMTDSIGETRGSHLPDNNVFWLLVHGMGSLFQPIVNLNNPRSLHKQIGLSGNDPTATAAAAAAAEPPNPFISVQHLRPLIVADTSATRNPPATHHRPPARDRSGEETLTLPADRTTERYLQSYTGDAGKINNGRLYVATKTRITTPERETTRITSISRLRSSKGQHKGRNDSSSSNDRTSETTNNRWSYKKSQSSLQEPNTTQGKEDGLRMEQQLLGEGKEGQGKEGQEKEGQEKEASKHHNVLINSIVSTFAFVNFNISFLYPSPLLNIKENLINKTFTCFYEPLHSFFLLSFSFLSI